MTDFVHLDVHSEFSIIDSLVRLGPLCAATQAQKMMAVGVSDVCNLFAMVKFYKKAQTAGLKALIGAELWVACPDNPDNVNKIQVICRNEVGYRHLSELITAGFMTPDRDETPVIQEESLFAKSEGLIVLMGQHSRLGRLALRQETDAMQALIQHWQNCFGDAFYLRLQRIGHPHDEVFIQQAVPAAAACGCPVVASNAVRFLRPEDFEAHEARVCIREGQTLAARRQTPYTREQYLKTPAEMTALFEDIPEAIENTVEIAKRCTLPLKLGHSVLPRFPIPAGETEDSYLVKAAEEGLEARLAVLFSEKERAEKREEYHQRLKVELDVIINMGFPGYFLIVADFIQWAKDNHIPVGPGRGSGAGSLVAYSLKITDLDPIAYELLFERFLNPERVSMPDFDVDFCMDNRDRVIDYVAQKYGRDSVSQIVTFGTMAAKAVVRDVGRVLGHPYGFVDKIAKLIPFEIGMTLNKALEQEEALKAQYDGEEEVKALIDLALKLEGLTRNVGKHAGGVVIAPSKLTDFSPLYCEQNSQSIVTQFDKDDVEAIGLVKFDFLGLRTLTIIDWAVKNANRQRQSRGETPIDINHLPLDDEKTFALLKKTATTAVFQLESRGMKELIGRLQPDAFEEIIALVALFRPGPLQSGMVDDFINRKHGRQKVEYLHPDIAHVLKPTYGVILYQEQVMQIAQVLAGYTLGGADLLRRAMGKKKAEEMAEQRQIFTTGAVERGVPEAQATTIFDLMEKFAGYGFNKSHSAAYALVSYQTAWLKAHYPTAFMAAVLSADMNHTDKVVRLIEEARSIGIAVKPPDVNQCFHEFTVVGRGQIGYGMGAIKGVGESAIDAILEARREHGTFKDLYDFCDKIDTRRVNRRVLECLIRAGALDSFGLGRAAAQANLPGALQAAEQSAKDKARGQADLFAVCADEESQTREWISAPDWSDATRLQGEKDTLGLYLTGHPFSIYAEECAQFTMSALKDIKPIDKKKVRVAGLMTQMRTMLTKRGDKMAFIQLDDRTARLEVAVFADVFQAARDKLEKDQILIIEGQTSLDQVNQQPKVRAMKVLTLAEAREQYAKGVLLKLKDLEDAPIDTLKSVLGAYEPGPCVLRVCYEKNATQTVLRLGKAWAISPTPILLNELKKAFGEEAVEVNY